MDLRIKITQQPLELPERDADKLEKEIQGRMSKDYWDDHIRDCVYDFINYLIGAQKAIERR